MKNSVLIHKKQTISVDKQPEHSWVREEEIVYSDIHVSLRTRSRSLLFHIHCQTACRQCWSEGISSMSWISMTPLRRNNSLSFPFSENIKVYLSISDIKIQCLNDSFECALSSAYSMPLLKLPWTPRGNYTGNTYSSHHSSIQFSYKTFAISLFRSVVALEPVIYLTLNIFLYG